jgi:hypothetical protein
MVHKTISAANELRAPPLAQWKRPKLVNHSRKVGIEQFRIRQALMARARSFNSPCPPMTNKRVCTRVNVRWVDGWAVSRERGRLRLDRHWRQGEHLRVAPWICMLCLFPCGSLQEFFLIVGVGFRKLGPRSLSATPEYVILAGICFPRSEACATFGLLAQELERVEPPSRAWCVRTVKLAL